ncbi:MAG: 5'-deoxynucleotidase, partial [Eubacterium sp.]|nr:5'-deoxynucleotidase [Eubacterium sp.]
LSEHSLEVAMIAHALAVIGNVRYDRNLDENSAALIGLYHDSSEIITGDMPTPVKYYNPEIKEAYKEVEKIAEYKLLQKLPSDLRPAFEKIYKTDNSAEDHYLRRLVKAADKISAYIKCIEEEKAGNTEFKTAKASIGKSLDKLSEELPEVKDFVDEFLPPYGKTLDELS